MLKRYLLLAIIGLSLAACTREDAALPPGATDEETVPVQLSVEFAEGQFQNSTGYEPMSRANEVQAQIRNEYLCLIMKNIDGAWIVERLVYPKIDNSQGTFTDLKITDGLPENKLEIELTPGVYKMTVVLNPRSAKVFDKISGTQIDLYPKGSVILPAGAPQSELPQLIGYMHLGPQYGSSFKQEEILYNEIFAGTTDFTVSKTTELNPSGTAIPVSVATTRRVGSFRVYFLETGVDPDFSSARKTYFFFNLTARNGARFCEGLDMWGNPYYSDEPLTYMDGAFVNTEAYISTALGRFKIPAKNGSRWFGHYYFTDPAVTAGVPFTIGGMEANEVSGGTNWYYYGSVDRILYHNQQDAIALKSLPGIEEVPIWTENGTQTEYRAEMDLARDGQGKALDVIDLFAPNFDWNTNVE